MDDLLDRLEAEGRQRRAERQAAQKTSEAKERRRRGRNAVNVGRHAERRVAGYFGGDRVPLSGRLGGQYAGDVILPGGLRVEVKRREDVPTKRLRAWLEQGQADLLVLLEPRQEVEDGLVVLRPRLAKTLLGLLTHKNGPGSDEQGFGKPKVPARKNVGSEGHFCASGGVGTNVPAGGGGCG